MPATNANDEYFHSVRLITDKCQGCTNCIKRCPTEAIRVRDGKAYIIESRCIDCGECIRVCPNHAKVAYTDGLKALQEYEYNIAIPAPALHGQFRQEINVDRILTALRSVGFDGVFEVALGADYVTAAYRRYIAEAPPGPLISSSCPAVVRLIQVRFPELIPNLIPIESPMEVAAHLARQEFSQQNGVDPESIGIFFITPCPAKVTAIKQPVALQKSNVNGAISISEIYNVIIKHLSSSSKEIQHRASARGIGWARSGGEVLAVCNSSHLAVDGIHNVLSVLEEVDMGRLNNIRLLECQACVGGCVGGALTVENPYVARIRIRQLTQDLPDVVEFSEDKINELYDAGFFHLAGSIDPRPILRLDDNILVAMQKVEQVEELVNELPGLDCGACGAPTCRALAEDIVQGSAVRTDCIIELRSTVKELAAKLMDLAGKLPPAMGRDKAGADNEPEA